MATAREPEPPPSSRLEQQLVGKGPRIVGRTPGHAAKGVEVRGEGAPKAAEDDGGWGPPPAIDVRGQAVQGGRIRRRRTGRVGHRGGKEASCEVQS